MPEASGQPVHVALDAKMNPSPVSASQHRDPIFRTLDRQFRSWLERLCPLRKREPPVAFGLDEQNFDTPPRSHLSRLQPCCPDTAVVDDQQVPLAEKFGESPKHVMVECTRRAAELHQPTPVPLGRWMPGDRLRRQRVVKLRQRHRPVTVPALFEPRPLVMLGAVRFCPHCFSIYTSQVDYCGIDGTKLREEQTDPLVGRVLDRYRVLQRLGLGAMGCVYRVAHTFLEHEYAMKVLFGDLSANKRVVERFRREAQVVSKVRHPNVVAVTDFGTTDNGLTFLVMEHVDGRTLAEIIATEAPFTPSRAAMIARQIAAGLGEAHRQEFVHRDVKPSNVMVWTDGQHEYVKLLDFGIVGLLPGVRSARITGSGHFVGTPLYMAPEQSRDPLKTTPSADLYSLGVILYEMLAGEPPFRADSVVDLFIQHSTAPVPPMPAAQGLEMLVHWLLKKRPEDRPASTSEVIAELDRLAAARTHTFQLGPTSAAATTPTLEAPTLDATHDGVESPSLPPSLPAAADRAYPDVEPTPVFPMPAVAPRIGREPSALNYDFLRGRLDAVTERVAHAALRADIRVIMETRLRHLQATLHADLDSAAYQRWARDLGDLDRELRARSASE